MDVVEGKNLGFGVIGASDISCIGVEVDAAALASFGMLVD
jgi:hypothetical protein